MRRLMLLLSVLVMVAMLVTACAPKAPVVSPPVAEEKGGTLVIANVTDMVQLDPIDIGDAPSSFIAAQIFDALVKRDYEGNLVPSLATSWSTSADGLIWSFTLREGVKFHDGEPFNADVVKWHIDRIQSPDSVPRFRTQFSVIKEVVVVDEYKVDFILTAPNGAFIEYTLMTNAGMIPSPKAFRERGDKFAFEPQGTGPFKFVSWTSGQQVVAVRNEDYWKGAPLLDGITWRAIPEAATRIIELETGGVNYIQQPSQEDIARIQASDKMEVYNVGAYNVRYLSMNMNDPLFGDIKVRQALAHALDFESIVDALLEDVVSFGTALVPNTSWAHPGDVFTFEHNLDKAAQMLADAGWVKGADGILAKDGKKFDVAIHSPNGRYLMDKEICEVVQEDLSKIGIKVTVRVLEWGAFLDDVRAGNYQFAFLGWAQSSPEPSLFIDPLAVTGGRGNYCAYSNAQVDEWAAAAVRTSDLEERKELYAKIVNLINEEAPYIQIYNENKVVAITSNVQGYVHSPAVNDFTEIWIKK